MTSPRQRSIEALCLRSMPLGEQDRLLTVLSDSEGVVRLAASGARRQGSSLAAVGPLTLLRGEVQRGRSLSRLSQTKLLRSYTRLGQQLETLAAGQWLAELALMLVPEGAALPGVLPLLLHRLEQLEQLVSATEQQRRLESVGLAVQGGAQLLAMGGYGLPLDTDQADGSPLRPPVGEWSWRCSLLPADGFHSGAQPGALMLLNASELALLQRLLRPELPRRANGELMGPETVWLRLLDLLGHWCREHLGRCPRALSLLRQDWPEAAVRNSG
jgi:DNA repair protein RecO (recombination protein O)